MAKCDLSAYNLRARLDYDSRTGIFTWRRKRQGPVSGDSRRAGCRDARGYVKISCLGTVYYAHRLAWLYHYGSWPQNEVIDHIDGDTSNNAISNLRDVSQSTNVRNRKVIKSKTGIKGVRQYGNRFAATITTPAGRVQLGMYATAEDARAVYAFAERVFREEWSGLSGSPPQSATGATIDGPLVYPC